jgi:hypothetical protein
MSQFGYTNPKAVPQRGAARPNAAAAVKTIPFDYVFQFALQGKRGNKTQDVVEISTEGLFVALSVGYSLVVDEKSVVRTFQPVINQNTILRSPSLVPFLSSNSLTKLFITGTPDAEIAVLLLATPPVTPIIDPISSLPAIVTRGRIGSDGTVLLDLTPAIPPQSQILVWDRTNNLFSPLFEIGSVPNGTPSTPMIGPDPVTKKLPAAGNDHVHIYGSQGTSVDLTLFKSDGSKPIEKIGIQLNKSFDFATGASASGSQVTLDSSRLSLGDLLIVGLSPGGSLGVRFSAFAVPRVRLSNITLGALTAGLEKSGADLTRGFRLDPDAAGLVAADLPIDQISAGTLGRIFETGCVAAEEASFLYSLDVGGTGREYQSKPIHNIAGLGIANGDRPFRPFAKPVMFEPRSSVRIQVEELSGPPGTLFIVLQGYKMLGTGRIPV